MESHAEFLRVASNDPALAAAARADWREADLTPRERAILEFVEPLTLRPADMTRAHLDALRQAGLTDRGVAQVAVIAGLFALFNRMADALGVGRGPRGDHAAGTVG
ncbi:MAG: carboxymuconolactone decarboxylase family protein [Planctomycetes bacterium]|nr:carboxymuconolactone decarboxylase family protein [Planctomycetota bacterium]